MPFFKTQSSVIKNSQIARSTTDPPTEGGGTGGGPRVDASQERPATPPSRGGPVAVIAPIQDVLQDGHQDQHTFPGGQWDAVGHFSDPLPLLGTYLDDARAQDDASIAASRRGNVIGQATAGGGRTTGPGVARASERGGTTAPASAHHDRWCPTTGRSVSHRHGSGRPRVRHRRRRRWLIGRAVWRLVTTTPTAASSPNRRRLFDRGEKSVHTEVRRP